MNLRFLGAVLRGFRFDEKTDAQLRNLMLKEVRATVNKTTEKFLYVPLGLNTLSSNRRNRYTSKNKDNSVKQLRTAKDAVKRYKADHPEFP